MSHYFTHLLMPNMDCMDPYVVLHGFKISTFNPSISYILVSQASIEPLTARMYSTYDCLQI